MVDNYKHFCVKTITITINVFFTEYQMSMFVSQPETEKPDLILSFQRRTKQKVVTDFATVSKGTSAGAKPRAALRQVLFSQGVSEKNPASEVLSRLLLVTLNADYAPKQIQTCSNCVHAIKCLKQPTAVLVVFHMNR